MSGTKGILPSDACGLTLQVNGSYFSAAYSDGFIPITRRKVL